VIDPRPYLGIPYAADGRDRPGLDCWGLVRLVYRESLGIDLPAWDTVTDADAPAVHMAMAQEARCWIAVSEPQAGDVVLLRRFGRPGHCGIVIGGGRFLHVEPGGHASAPSLTDPREARRIEGFYRHPGLANLRNPAS
jgi:cell wall-associated NlpC family hydrolase